MLLDVEYPNREHLFKSDRRLGRMVLSEGSKEKKKRKEKETSEAKWREKEF
jgi:hypothetical protein